MNSVIEIRNLFYSYGKSIILYDICFSVARGDFFIIIGPNGSGKTTLMKIISGLAKSEKDRVHIMGQALQHYSRKTLATIMSFVPQSVPIDFPFTVLETVLMGRAPHLGILGLEQERDVEIAYESMRFTGVEHLSGRRLDQLSGGERQRVIIAKAICQEPKMILLDEPTASLDLANQIRIMDLMEKLKHEKKMTIVMVSHDINLAAMYCDHMLLLDKGKIMSIGLPKEVLTFQILEKAYGCTLLVDANPLGDFPRITPVPKRFIESRSD